MKYYVAKSYEGLPVVEEEYTKNGRTYCKVRTTKGVAKEVRTYTQEEWNKLYGVITPKKSAGTVVCEQKHLLGFDKGYITIFKGAVVKNEHFFEQSCARFHIAWGWYIVSTEEVPKLPDGVTAVKLNWEDVAANDKMLKPIEEVKKICQKLLRN